FFQAEDGIRDRNVTGVQTCALPILVRQCLSTSSHRPRRAMRVGMSSRKADPAKRMSTTDPGVQPIAYIVFAIGPDTAKKNAEARVSRNPTMTERLILDLLKCWCAGGSDRGQGPRRGGSSTRRACAPQRPVHARRSGHVRCGGR